MALWSGEGWVWEFTSSWMGPPIPSPVPGQNDRADLQAVGHSPIIRYSNVLIRELHIYQGTNNWGLRVDGGATLTVTGKITLESKQYGGTAGGESRLTVAAGSNVIAGEIENHGAIRVDGALTAGLLVNTASLTAYPLIFGAGSTFNGALLNRGSMMVEVQEDWSVDADITNEQFFISYADRTTLEDGSSFTNSRDVQLENLNILSGSSFNNKDGGELFLDNGFIEIGGYLANYGEITIEDMMTGIDGTIVNHGVFRNFFGLSYQDGRLRGNVENHGTFVSSVVNGDFTNFGLAVLASTVTGDFVSSGGAAEIHIVSREAIFLDNPVAEQTTSILEAWADVSWYDTTVTFDLGDGSSNNRDRVALWKGDFELQSSHLILNSYKGFQFAAGDTCTLVEVQSATASIAVANTMVTVNGQHADFAYAVGVMAGTNDLVLTALNSGATGGAVVLDLSTGTTGAAVIFSDDGADGSVRGGTFAATNFYRLHNVHDVKGTNSDDLFHVFSGTDATARGFVFTGLGGNDIMQGGRGDDVLNGGTGNDDMSGGAGNDIYYVNTQSDRVTEMAGEGLADRVAASADYALAADVEVEFLRTTSNGGTAAINLTGNKLRQEITGNAGANVLNEGGAGAADKLIGLGGDDTYRIHNAAAMIVETATQGTADKVMTSVSYKLGAGVFVEQIQTSSSAGTTAINLIGNEVAQKIVGNAGTNIIDGKGGSDTLFGGSGKDYFTFSTALGASNVDTVGDFNVVADTIRLENAIFSALTATGALAASAFRANAAGTTQDADDFIVYQTGTGKLFYDADGNGVGAAIHFATLTGNPAITAADFLVI
jgi:Ca2+-binding RTX toxin-like protein